MSERLVPALFSRGFEGPRTIAGNALLHQYRRRTPQGTRVITIQLEKHGLPRFLLGLYVEPPEGMEKLIADGGVVISGHLKPGKGASSRSWFRADRSWWKHAIFGKQGTVEGDAVDLCVAMLGEVDAWWSDQVPSAHITVWPVKYPGTRSSKLRLLCAIFTVTSVVGLTAIDEKSNAGASEMEATRVEEVAQSSRQWTGIAVLPNGRIFVNFPRWSDDVPVSVAEVGKDGTIKAFPDEERNSNKPPVDKRFVCVQSVVVDKNGDLWVLDTGNPKLSGVIDGAPKLMRFDPVTGKLTKSIYFAQPVITRNSYLNDVRIDTKRNVAYLTDSGVGAIIVTDLRRGTSRRLLSGHVSVLAEDVDLVIDGKTWPPGGQRLVVHSDGVALTPDGKMLYFRALTSRTLYRIETRYLRDKTLDPKSLEARVVKVGATGFADGLECGPDGTLYLTSLEDDAVKRLNADGTLSVVAKDDRLQWPDSISFGPEGFLYVTTSRIHLGSGPYGIFRFKP